MRRAFLLSALSLLVAAPVYVAPASAVEHREAPLTTEEIPWPDVLAHDPFPGFELLGFNDSERRLLSFVAQDAGDAPTYRFGDDTSGSPTLDIPGASIVSLTAAAAVLPADVVEGWPEDASTQDGVLYLRSGAGPVNGPMTLFGASFEGPLPITDMEYWVNMGFVTAFPDSPQWASDFPGDTWWGGFRMPTVEYGPNPWSLTVFEFAPPQTFDAVPMDGFGLISGDTLIIGIDSADLASGGYDISQLGYGLHLHISDESLGFTPDSESIVSSYPFPTGRTYDDLLQVLLLDPILAGSTVPPAAAPTTSEAESASAPSVTTTQAAPVAPPTTLAQAATPLVADETSSLPAWLLLAGGLALFTAGAGVYSRNRRRLATTAGTTDDPGSLFVKGLLQLGTQDKPSLDTAWASLVKREASLQRRLKNQWVAARKDLAKAFGEYEKAMRTFKENAVKVMSATTVFDKLLTQGTENIATSKKVDFVWGVGQLGLAGVRAAIARFVKAPPTVPWGGADEVAGAASTATRTGAPPGFVGRYRDAAEVMDRSILGRLADEAGVDLAKFMSGFENAAEGGKALVSAVAQARGWVPLSDDAQALIRRLLDAGTTVIGNPGTRIDPADLAQLVKWADEVPDFWSKLARAADWFETAGWQRQVDQLMGGADRWGARFTETLELLYRSDDISYLRNLVERTRTGWTPPRVPDEFTDFPAVGVGRLPRQNVPGVPSGGPTSAPTVLSGPRGGAPTVLGDSWAEVPTVLSGPRAAGPPTAPTFLDGPAGGSPTVIGSSWADAPTVLSGPRGTPTVVGSGWADAPTVLSGPRGVGPPTTPTVLDGPGWPSLPTVADGPGVVVAAPGGPVGSWGGPLPTLTEPGTGYLNGTDAFLTISGGTQTASWFAHPASDTPMTLAGHARFHGVDPDLFWAANPPSGNEAVIGSLITTVGRKAEWHQLPVDVGMLCDKVLLQGKTSISSDSGGSLDAQLLEDLSKLCAADDFTNWLTTSYVDLPEAVVFPYSCDDAVFLETLCQVGGDHAACGEALGPVWTSALETTELTGSAVDNPFAGSFGMPPAGTVTADPLFRPVSKADRAKYERTVVNTFRNSTTSAYLGLGQIPGMLGNLDEKTSQFHFMFWTFENSVLATGWQALSSPFETMTAAYYSGRAYQELGNLLNTHSKELDAMSSSFRAAGRAIDSIKGVLAGLTAADGLLGGRAETALQGFLDEYQKLYDRAPASWKQSHKADLDKRRAHIRQKQYQLVRALRPIRKAIPILPKLNTWLAGLRKKGGTQLELINPEVWVRLGAVAMQINAMLAEAFLSGGRPPGPPPRRVPPKQKFDWDKAAEDWEEMERKKKTMPKDAWEKLYIEKYGMPPMDW